MFAAVVFLSKWPVYSNNTIIFLRSYFQFWGKLNAISCHNKQNILWHQYDVVTDQARIMLSKTSSLSLSPFSVMNNMKSVFPSFSQMSMFYLTSSNLSKTEHKLCVCYCFVFLFCFFVLFCFVFLFCFYHIAAHSGINVTQAKIMKSSLYNIWSRPYNYAGAIHCINFICHHHMKLWTNWEIPTYYFEFPLYSSPTQLQFNKK